MYVIDTRGKIVIMATEPMKTAEQLMNEYQERGGEQQSNQDNQTKGNHKHPPLQREEKIN